MKPYEHHKNQGDKKEIEKEEKTGYEVFYDGWIEEADEDDPEEDWEENWENYL